MKRIRIMNVSIDFDANQTTVGDNISQARAALEQINLSLQREPYGLAAQIISIDEMKENDIELVPGYEH